MRRARPVSTSRTILGRGEDDEEKREIRGKTFGREGGYGGTDSATAPAGLGRTVGRRSALGTGSSVHVGRVYQDVVVVNLGYENGANDNEVRRLTS